MKPKRMQTRAVMALLAVLAAVGVAQPAKAGGNVNGVSQWAWSTNAGWINLIPVNGGVTVCADHLEDYAWGENIGWIRMGTFSGCGAHTYSNTSTSDYGVNKSPSGKLSGYAWSTNAGWINFDPDFGGVSINPNTGSIDGYAWAENFGWIHFKGAALRLPLIQR
jgi:hypothetical protein